MKTLSIVAFLFLLMPGCATGPFQSTPSDPIREINEAWVRDREMYYRNTGWNSLDASSQAMQDLQNGKTSPVDRPPIR